MKGKIITFFIIILLISAIQSFGQLDSVSEKLSELNELLKIESNDASFLEISRYCGVLDTEYNNQTYQYNLSNVIIEQPFINNRIYIINIICLEEYEECILFDRREDVDSKDFILRTESAANQVYKLLIELQNECN